MSDFASPTAVPRERAFPVLVAVAACFVAIKLVYVFRVGPIFDEAYYWMWGQHPGLSYFDHPPFHAWLLGLSDAIFGRSLLGIRWMTIATLVGTLYIYHLIAKRMAGAAWRNLWWPGVVIYLASPTFGYFTSLAFHDYLLVFLLLVSGYFFLNVLEAAEEGRRPRHLELYVAAIVLGCAGLTKYNAVFLGLGVFAFILWRPSLRKLLRDPHLYVAAFVAIAMQAPTIIWNAQDGFASFNFHLSARHEENWLSRINWNSFIDFPLASAFLISPFLVPVFWRFFVRRPETGFEGTARGLAIWVFWLSSATFLAVSLFDWVFWWWNLAAYVLPLAFASRHMGRKWLFWGHVTFGALVQLYLIISVTILPLSLFHGPIDWRQSRLYGWEELGASLAALRAEYEPDFIASNGPDLSSTAAFALDDPGVVALTDRKTQFYYWFDKEAHRGEDALVVLFPDEGTVFVESQFESLEPVGSTDITRFGYWINGFRFYIGHNYQPDDEPGQQGG